MISIVVSTYKPKLFAQFEKNVAKTIGVEYEIVKIDNSGLMGLCAAYNIGIKRAKFDYICFCHDDVLFHTNNWGNVLINYFKSDSNIGLIGIAGGTYKTLVPSGWSFPEGGDSLRINFMQERNGVMHKIYHNPQNQNISEVASVDGCFFATNRQVIGQYKFDEQTFQKYHCYDVDFSLTVGTEYKVMVTYDIQLEHLSEGSFDKSWIEETFKLHNKWNSVLPRSTEKLTNKEILNQESGAYFDLIKKMSQTGTLNYSQLFKIATSSSLINLLGLVNWFKFNLIVYCKLIANVVEKLAYKFKLKR